MKKVLLFSILVFASLQTNGQCNATVTPLGPTTFCQLGSVYLVASPGDSFQWYESGVAIAGATNDTFFAFNSGDYQVVIDSAGCIDTSAVVNVVEHPPLPAPSAIMGPDSICNASIQTYNVTPVPGAIGYVWHGISTLGMYVGIDTTILPTITGNVLPSSAQPYTIISVSALDTCGTGDWATMQVKDFAPPQIGGHWNVNEIDVAEIQTRVCPGNQYTLFPIMHAAPGIVYTDPHTFQWYLDNIPIPGATNWKHTITHGGNYSVKISTTHCNMTYTVPKKVYQDVPNSITISPPGPLNYCTNNATPLTVSFDMAGVSDPLKWYWMTPHQGGPSNTYSHVPDTPGYYTVMATSKQLVNCYIFAGNAVQVTVPPTLDIFQVDDTLFATPGYNSYQWFESGVAIPGATQQKHTLTFDGIYSIEGLFSNGCVETSDTFDSDFLLPPPWEEELLNDQMTISPNPVVGVFKLVAKVAPGDKSATINVTDATGRALYEKTVDVVDGVVSEEIDMGKGISSLCIIKLQTPGSSKTTRFYKRE